MAGKIIVPILSAFSAKGVNDAKSSLGKLADTMKGFGGMLAGGAGLGGIGAGGGGGGIMDAVGQARDLERNMNALNQVFEEYSTKATMFVKSTNAIGMSQSEAAKATVFIGSVMKQSGFSMDEVSVRTEKLVALASDLAITYGYDVQEALTGMTALFRGEYDPIEKFGVAMKQAEVNALVAERGLSKLTGQAKLNAQQIARYDLLMQRAADSTGAFARQSDTLFAAQKRVEAGFKDFLAQIGEPLLGGFGNMMDAFATILTPLTDSLIPAFEIFGKTMSLLSPAIKAIGELLTAIVGPAFEFLAEVMYGVVSIVMPIFLGFMKILTPIMEFLGVILKGLTGLLDLLIIPFKLVAIVIGFALKAIGDFLDFVLGGLIDGLMWAFGDFFGQMGSDTKALNQNLDQVIGNLYGVDLAVKDLQKTGERGISIRIIETWKAADPADENKDPLADARKRFRESIRDLLKNLIPNALVLRELGDFEQAIVTRFADIGKSIAGAVEDGLISKKAAAVLVAYSTKVQIELAKIARKRDELAKKYSLAKAFIADTKEAVMEFASLSNLLSDSGTEVVKTVTYMTGKFQTTLTSTVKGIASATDVIGKFRNILQSTKDFAANLATLSQMGIAEGLYKQILAGGLESGAALAEGLVQGGQSAVNEISALFEEQASVASMLGEQAAQVMYGAGIDVSDGLIKGILEADKPLVEAAEKLASAFTTAFKRGMNMGLSGLGFIMPSVDPNYAENATNGSVYNINVNAGMGADGIAVGRAVVKVLKDYERINGTSWRAGIA
jgi:hypothetical protein